MVYRWDLLDLDAPDAQRLWRFIEHRAALLDEQIPEASPSWPELASR